MKNRNTPTPLGTLGFLARDTFNRVVPYLNHASRRALGTTSPGFYRLINSCELAYLPDMPVNEQIAALYKLAIHLSELDTCYTALPYTQIGGSQEDNQAIQGLVVARLRRSMNGVFANDLVAALTLTCLARLDPKSYEEHQAHRALAYSSIHPAEARTLRKLIYPAHHPLLVLMPREFSLTENFVSQGQIALCRAIDKPKVARKLATQQQSIQEYSNCTSKQALHLLQMPTTPKASMALLLLKLNQKDEDELWDEVRLHKSNGLPELILRELPKLIEKWEGSLPYPFIRYVEQDISRLLLHRVKLAAWVTDVLSILLASEHTKIINTASEMLTDLITSPKIFGSLSDSEIAALITLLQGNTLEFCFRKLLNLKDLPISRMASIIEVFVAQMEPATAAKELEWAIENCALNSLTPIIEYAKKINSRTLLDQIFSRQESDIFFLEKKYHHFLPLPQRVIGDFVELLPTTDKKLEIIKPLIAIILQKKQSSKEWFEKLPELSKILLRFFANKCTYEKSRADEWPHDYLINDEYTHDAAITFIKILTSGLSNEQACDIFREAQEDYFPNDESWSGFSDHEKSQWHDRYAALYLSIAYKLPITHLLESELLTSTLKRRNHAGDYNAINTLAEHILQSDAPTLQKFSLVQKLMIDTNIMAFVESIFEKLPDFSVNVDDEEQALLVNILCQFRVYCPIENGDLEDNVLKTLKVIASRLTSQQATEVFNYLEGEVIRGRSKHILPIISIVIDIKDKIPFNKNSTVNDTMRRVKNMLRTWLNHPLEEHDTSLQHRVRNAALQALGQYVDYLDHDDIEHMLGSFYLTVSSDIKKPSDATFIIPIMHLLSPRQLDFVIADIHRANKLASKDTCVTEAKTLSKIIARLKEIGRDDLIPILCESPLYAAACSTQFSGLLMEEALRRPLLHNDLLDQERSRFKCLLDRVCTPAFEPANTPLELAANIVTYIKSINHTLGTARFDDEHRSRTTTVKSLLAMQTIAACLDSFQDTESAKIILFHLVILQLSIEAADRDLEFLFPTWDFSVYRRYHDLETRVVAYCDTNRHKKYAVDELRLQIDKLSDMDDPLIPHSIIQCLFQLDMSAKYSDETAVNFIRDYCRQVENVERLNELTCLLVAARKNELAPLLQRKHSFSIHRHVLKPLELYEFGIAQEEPCSETAVKIFKIIHDARMVLLKALPQAVVVAEEVVDEDDFVVIMSRK
jgi:hypothetical protein